MQPFWDVLQADALALAKFVGPMAALATLASVIAAFPAGVAFRFAGWRNLLFAACCGASGGVLIALVLSMLIEYDFKAEGFINGRRAMQDYATWPLILAAPVAAVAVTILAVRRLARAEGTSSDRRFSLRQLFVAQFIVALLLGWWAYTRRDEIGHRRTELERESIDEQARAVFGPLGWRVATLPDRNEVELAAAPHYMTINDEALRPVPSNDAVAYVFLKSDEVTDHGVGYLRGSHRLRRVHIASSQVTDSGVAHLIQLPRLRVLELHCPEVTGEGLKDLAQMRPLRYLTITSDSISEQAEAEFRAARPETYLRVIRQP